MNELDEKRRRKVQKQYKARNAGFRNKPLSYQFCIFCPDLYFLENYLLFVDEAVGFKDLMGRLINFIKTRTKLKAFNVERLRDIRLYVCN
jgi:hypothetical protein